MDERRGKRPLIVLSSEDEEYHDQEQEVEDDDDCDEEQEDDDDCDEVQGDDDYCDEKQEDNEYSDYDDESDDSDNDDDDESLSDKVVALLQEGNDIESWTLQECKAYLRTHGLRLAGNRAVCVDRINEHLRLKDGNGYALYPRSSFNINCTGDVCMGDVVLFRQRVYEKFDKVTRHGRILRNRTIAGRIVKESYGAAKQQHTFTVEVLWSSGFRKLSPLSPLLVKGRNLYKQKTYRQRWKNEADRIKVLSEKHRRGAAARIVRAVRQKKKSSYANGSNGSKRQLEIQNTKRSKIRRSCELDKVSHLGGRRKAIEFQPQEAFRYARGWQKSAEYDHYQAPSYPSYSSYGQRSYHSHVNSQGRNEQSEFLYYERGLIPNMIGFPPFRPYVGEFTSRSRPLVSSDCHRAHTNLRYNFDMPLQFHPRANYGYRKYDGL